MNLSSVKVYSQSLSEKYNESGLEKSKKEDYNGALLDYDKAIELNPQIDEYYTHRGHCKYALSDFEGALKDFDKAILINPKIAEHYFNRGQALVSNSKPNQALDDFNKAIELNDTVAYYYSNRAFCKYKADWSRKKYDAYIEDYNRAINLDSDNSNYYFNRGVFHYEIKNFKNAIIDLSKSIQLDSAQTQAYYFRGLSRIEIGDSSGCLDLYQSQLLDEPLAKLSIKKYCSNIKQKDLKNLDSLNYNPNAALILLKLDTMVQTNKFFEQNQLRIQEIGNSIFSLPINICQTNTITLSVRIDTTGKNLNTQIISGTSNIILDSLILNVVNNFEGNWFPYKIDSIAIEHNRYFIFGLTKIKAIERYFPQKIDKNPLHLYLVKSLKEKSEYKYKEECENNEHYYRKGVSEFLNKSYKLAEYNFSKALIENPNDMDSQYNLGMSYLKLEETEKACECFKKCALLGDQIAINQFKEKCSK
ncbi:MAG: hypothetical protein A3K10_03315 [Bacteroidetes bacterium RIFCSPLOWO2_12_FULL_31_6]|nr:MAG: hypothetical protein A3K10_03315 [Bacteroidetes bacterium RIFCSPLOWO2_12_FULL_31_6]